MPGPGSSDALLLRDARDLYLAANGFSVQDYGGSTFTLRIIGVPLKLPNTKGRKRVIPLHDLHHVLTGYATDWAGEAEIGAWELRGGCTTFEAYFLNASGVVIGFFLCPRRVWRAFRTAAGQRTLYLEDVPYERLLQMTVREVRERLGIPPQGFHS
jgi:hypothetical protein